MSEAVTAPSLSTAQNEEETFAQVADLTEDILREKRYYLGPKYISNQKITSEETRNIINDYYSLDKLAIFLNSRDPETEVLKYQLISLQFPDYLVCDSTIVSQILQTKLNKLNKEKHDLHHSDDENSQEIDFTVARQAPKMNRDIESLEKTIDSKTCSGNCGSKCKNKDKFLQEVWILADTSYSPCCIDEVAAEHVKADIVVHFGDACLNPVEKIESAYIFGKPYLDIQKLADKFREIYSNKDDKIAVMADTTYSGLNNQLYNVLKEEYTNLVFADVDYSRAGKRSTIIDKSLATKCNKTGTINTAHRILRGFEESEIDEYLENIDQEDEGFVESSKFDGLTQDYSLFHITMPHDARILLLTTKFADVKIIDPKDISVVHDQFPTMMKRYRNMQVTRSASTVGVLVNTLSLENTRVLLNKITKSICEAGKKHYMFVVGKPNVAKLANFECVDVWVVLGCGQSGIVIDQYGDYYKPIITPYELQLALMPEITWTGKWITDFDDLLEEEKQETNESQLHNGNVKDTDYDENAPEFDPVTGTLKMNQPLRQLRHLELELESERSNSDNETNEETGLVKKFGGSLSVGKTISTSALGLQGRQWTGLGSDFDPNGSSEGAVLEEGRTGIARGYEDI